MKFLEIFLSFLATQGKSFFQSNTEALSKTLVNNARRVAILLAIAVISIALFCNGASMGYAALVESIAQGDGWTASTGLYGGIILALVSLGGLFYSLGEKRWLDATGIRDEAHEPKQPQNPPLESAFAILITEVALYLKESRKNAEHNSGDTP